mmetsp:Transcript_13209/g.55318  ORF Transcript_13209/g.55318 Transcript_13209/m.55318 type:complete len:219 (-) Transcript_13209:1467-2123(-)
MRFEMLSTRPPSCSVIWLLISSRMRLEIRVISRLYMTALDPPSVPIRTSQRSVSTVTERIKSVSVVPWSLKPYAMRHDSPETSTRARPSSRGTYGLPRLEYCHRMPSRHTPMPGTKSSPKDCLSAVGASPPVTCRAGAAPSPEVAAVVAVPLAPSIFATESSSAVITALAVDGVCGTALRMSPPQALSDPGPPPPKLGNVRRTILGSKLTFENSSEPT